MSRDRISLSRGEESSICPDTIFPPRPLLTLCTLLTLFTFSLTEAAERTSASFKDTRNSINAGGTRKTSTSFREDSALGELSLTTYTATSFRHRSGLLTIYYYPGTISDLAASTGPYAGSVRLTWTAPGAAPGVDGNTATASSYVIKWDTNTIAATQTAFNGATTYVQTFVPLAPTGSESRTLTGLTRNSTAYIRIEARDADGNQAYFSNEASSTTPATLVSITASPASYSFGSLYYHASAANDSSLASSSNSATAITATNDGNVRETYSLRATTATVGTPWSLGASTNTNVANLKSAIHGSRPSASQFATDDNLTYGDQTATSSVFSIDGSATGVNVDILENRSLWVNFSMPLMSDTTITQDLTLTITAQEQP